MLQLAVHSQTLQCGKRVASETDFLSFFVRETCIEFERAVQVVILIRLPFIVSRRKINLQDSI